MSKSQAYGGNGGDAFNITGIESIIKWGYVQTNKVALHGLEVTYDSTAGRRETKTMGGKYSKYFPYGFTSDERITAIKGYVGVVDGETVVKSLKFVTDKRDREPLGGEPGTPFTIQINGQIVGFHGRSSAKYLNSFGVYVKEEQKNIKKLGPYGGSGGTTPFDVSGIIAFRGANIVRDIGSDKSIGFIANVLFRRSGGEENIRIGNKVTGTSPTSTDMVPMDLMGAGLRAIKGRVGVYEGETIVKSLAFVVFEGNQLRTYGPFGIDEEGDPFEITGRFTGLHGRHGDKFLHSFGVYVEGAYIVTGTGAVTPGGQNPGGQDDGPERLQKPNQPVNPKDGPERL